MADPTAPPAPASPPRRPTTRTLRRAVGMLIVAGGAALLLQDLWVAVFGGRPHVEQALWGGLLAALATALGALPALLPGGTSERARNMMLGFGAGVMLAACSFSLVVPALAAARGQGQSPLAASAGVALAMLAGAAALLALEGPMQARLQRGQTRASAEGRRLASVWLFVLAVVLHNLPEGLAIGVGFAGDDPQAGRALTLAIAIQDVPEGLVVAMALRSVGHGRGLSVLMGALSGLGEPVAAVLGALIVGAASTLLPAGLAFAAGAMLFVIGQELIPASQRNGQHSAATGALVGGFALMMLLDSALA